MTGSRQQARTRRALIGLLAAIGVTTTPAQAGTPPMVAGANYYVMPCGSGLLSRGQGAWSFTFDCPSMTQSQVAPALPEENAEPDAATGLDGMVFVHLTMSGSNGTARGVQQGIRACSDLRCGPLVQPPSDDSPAAQYTLTAASGQLPAGADRVEFITRCIRTAGCPVGEGITFTDFAVGLVDRDPPQVHLSELDYPDPNVPPVLVEDPPGPWLNDTVWWNFEAQDPESGLLYTTFNAPRPERPAETSWEPQPCDPSILFPESFWCIADGGIWGRGSSVADLPQGLNTITTRSFDLVGNEAIATLPFRVDTVPPSHPAGLDVADAPNGWTGSTHAKLKWTNPPGAELGETATESGLVSARVDIDPVDPGWNDTTPETSMALDSLSSLSIDVPEPGEWNARVRLVDRAGNASDVRSVLVRVDPAPVAEPAIAPLSAITARTSADGVTVRWSLPQRPPSGICGYGAALNGVADYDPGDDPRTPDLVGDVTSWSVPAAKIADLDDGPTYVHLRGFSCAGAVGPLVHLKLTTDLTPPTVRAAPTPPWLDDPARISFSATDDSPSGNGSGVARIETSVDGAQAQATVGSVAVVALSEGGHTVAAVAVDAAGNRSAPARVAVGVDRTPPTATLALADPQDPALVHAAVNDGGAGLASATLEYRPVDRAAPWERLGRRVVPSAPTTDPLTLEARFPDEGELASGRYALRVVAIDALGHTIASSTRSDGEPAVIASPVRPRAVMTVQLSAAGVGEAATEITGQLTATDGAPIAGAAVDLVSALQGGAPEQVGQRLTDPAGAFRFPIAPGGSRSFTAIYRGTRAVGPARATVALEVHAGATLRITPRTLSRRGRGTFRGRVLSPGVALPLAGTLVQIDVRSAGRWRAFGEPTRTASDGSFRLGFTVAPRRRAVRVAFRARVPLQAGWPLLDGASPIATVVIAP